MAEVCIRPGKPDGQWRKRGDGRWQMTMPSGSSFLVSKASFGWRWEYHGVRGCFVAQVGHETPEEAQAAALVRMPFEESEEHAKHLEALVRARRRGRKRAKIATRKKKAEAKGRALRLAIDNEDDLEIARLMGWYKGRPA